MKVIAKVNGSTYLVEVTEDELAISAGFTNAYADGWKRHTSYAAENRGLVGFEVKPKVLASFHQTVEANEKKAKDCALMLHALAELITHSLPTVVITPKAEAAPAAAVGNTAT